MGFPCHLISSSSAKTLNNLLPTACQSRPDLILPRWTQLSTRAPGSQVRWQVTRASRSSSPSYASSPQGAKSEFLKSCNVQMRQIVMLTYLVDALMNVYSSLYPGSTTRSHRAWRRLRSQRAGSCVSGPPTLMRQRRAFGGTGTPFGLFPFGLFVVLVCSVHVSKGLIRNSVSTVLLFGQVLWKDNRIRTLAPRSTL